MNHYHQQYVPVFQQSPTDSMIDHTRERVVELNLQGLLVMQKGKHYDALVYFNQALKDLVVMEDITSKQSAIGINKRVSYEKQGRKALVSVSLVSAEHDKTSAYDEAFALFDRALHLQLNEISLSNENFCHIASAVLTYNAALAHHLSGLAIGNSGLLLKALDLYSMAYTSLTNQDTFLQQCPLTINFCLLALANNIGHIHTYFRSFDKTGICGDELAMRLNAVVPREQEMIAILDTEEGILPDEYKVFLLNTCLFNEEDFTAAPAA